MNAPLTSMAESAGSFTALFESGREALPGADRPALARRREEALARFAAAGLPTRKLEAWKFTSLAALGNATFSLPATADLDAADLPARLPDSCRLVFVNGRLNAALSDLDILPEGLALRRLDDLLGEDENALDRVFGEWQAGNAMLSLNAALAGDALELSVAPDAQVPGVLELLFVNRAGEDLPASHLRHRITLGRGAGLTLAERHIGSGRYVSSVATDVRLEANAALQHFRLQDDSLEAQHLSFLLIEAARDARCRSFVLTTGAALSRNEIHATLAGENAEVSLDGAYLLAGRQHGDTTTVLDHVSAHTSSSETYKGVIDDQARGVFQGRIAIARDAQRTQGHQLSKALLLSDRAGVDAKPELEIYADDVQCSHGATAGELNDDELFYLRARGIPEAEARGLLIEAFITDLVGDIANEGLRALYLAHIARWLETRA